MRDPWRPVLLTLLALGVFHARTEAAEERPSSDGLASAVTGLQPIDLRQIKIGGEIGRRIDITVYENLLALDVERDFLAPFRDRNKESGYIGLGKLIDATVRLAAYTNDEKVRSLKRHLVAEAIKTQEPDGYIGILVPKSRLWGVYDIHEMSYLTLGLTNDYRYFGEKTSLAAARKLADFIITRWSAEPDRIPGPDGTRARMYGVTTGLDGALLALYEQTKDRRYLDFLVNFKQYGLPEWNAQLKMDEPGKPYPMDDERHTYIYMALCVAQLQLYNLQPDERLLRQAERAVEFLTRRDGLLISGACSQNEAWHDNQCGSGNVSESCATAYLTRLMDRLLRLTGNAQFGDIMERTVYNALFAAQSPDGRRIRYFCPLEGRRKYFQDTFCCPNNFRRIMAELPAMVYYRSNNGVAVNVYTQSTANFDLGNGRRLTVRQETDYPISGHVKILVTPSQPTEFALRLRIPKWCPIARLMVNDETPTEVLPGEKFHEIRRLWRPADSAVLDMPMPWRLVRGRKLQEGRVALMRGPVLYCIGAKHNGELLKKYPKPAELVIDPASLGKPVADLSFRPDGLKVAAKAWPPGSRGEGAAPLDVVFGEFVDPTGVATYFRVPEGTKTVDDELTGER
jgi:uncharacterized protein